MAARASSSAKLLYPATVTLLALSVLFGFAVLPRLFPSGRSALAGTLAPDFALEVIHNGSPGDRIHLSELRGHPVVLDFWATWCQPCQVEAPVLDRVYRRMKDKGVVVVGVNTSDAQGRALAPKFAEAKSLSYPIVYDDGDGVAGKYGVQNLPTLVVIDGEGKIVAVRSGFEDEGQLEELVQQAL